MVVSINISKVNLYLLLFAAGLGGFLLITGSGGLCELGDDDGEEFFDLDPNATVCNSGNLILESIPVESISSFYETQITDPLWNSFKMRQLRAIQFIFSAIPQVLD
jgi:hypothetical protein